MMNIPIKWHGGKYYLASRIVSMMPKHVHYVEPYAGGLSVLLAKYPEGVSEVVNDIDGALTNFWQVIASDWAFSHFQRRVEAIPFSEPEWRIAVQAEDSGGPVGRAVTFFVLCRQSLAGRMKDFATLSRRRTRRGMNEQASAWLTAVEGLSEVHARLKRVVVLNREATDVIRQQDGSETLYYLDPPYFPDARTSPDVYAHEMTADQHVQLLTILAGIEGKFLLSGYRNPTYDHYAHTNGWHRTDFDLPNNAAGGAEKRRMTECVWTNFKPVAPGQTNSLGQRIEL